MTQQTNRFQLKVPNIRIKESELKVKCDAKSVLLCGFTCEDIIAMAMRYAYTVGFYFNFGTICCSRNSFCSKQFTAASSRVASFINLSRCELKAPSLSIEKLNRNEFLPKHAQFIFQSVTLCSSDAWSERHESFSIRKYNYSFRRHDCIVSQYFRCLADLIAKIESNELP